MSGDKPTDAPKAPSEGWAVLLEGDVFDIKMWGHLLQRPFDPWMEEFTDGDPHHLLRSSRWARTTEASEVWRDAEILVERINGATLLVTSEAEPVRAVTVMRFNALGKRDFHLLAATGVFKSRSRVWGAGAVVAAKPKPSFVQDIVSAADTDDDRAELLAHLARSSNWYELYKAMEVLQRMHRGPNGIKGPLGADYKEWSGARQTADHYRHAKNPKKTLPAPAPTFEEARQTVASLAKKLFDQGAERRA